MRRSASEIIRNLQQRVARLERKAGKANSDWDSPRNIDSIEMKTIRSLEGTRLLGWTLEVNDRTGATCWSNGGYMNEIWVSVDTRQAKLIFETFDESGDLVDSISGIIHMGGMDITPEQHFLQASKVAIRKLG